MHTQSLSAWSQPSDHIRFFEWKENYISQLWNITAPLSRHCPANFACTSFIIIIDMAFNDIKCSTNLFLFQITISVTVQQTNYDVKMTSYNEMLLPYKLCVFIKIFFVQFWKITSLSTEPSFYSILWMKVRWLPLKLHLFVARIKLQAGNILKFNLNWKL